MRGERRLSRVAVVGMILAGAGVAVAASVAVAQYNGHLMPPFGPRPAVTVQTP